MIEEEDFSLQKKCRARYHPVVQKAPETRFILEKVSPTEDNPIAFSKSSKGVQRVESSTIRSEKEKLHFVESLRKKVFCTFDHELVSDVSITGITKNQESINSF